MSNPRARTNELMQFAEEEPSSQSTALTTGDPSALLFDYEQIKNVDLRRFAKNRAVEIKRLFLRDRDLRDKLHNNRVQMGIYFQEMKDRLVSEEKLWLAWLRDEFNCTRPTDIRVVQQLMQIAREVQANPSLTTLASLDIRDYLAAELLAPSTPDEARQEVLEAVAAAKQTQKRLENPQALVRGAIDRHKPKPSGGSSRNGSALAPLPPVPKKLEIVAIHTPEQIAAAQAATAVVEVTRTRTKLQLNTLYSLGDHYAWTGAANDPRLLQMLPPGSTLPHADVLLRAVGIVAAPHNQARTVATFAINGILWLVSPDLTLMEQVLDLWNEQTGVSPKRLQSL